MQWHKETIEIQTKGKGLYKVTEQIERLVRDWSVKEGIVHLFIQHTSASLVASESYDPSARQDLEAFMDHLVPEGQPYFRHTLEARTIRPRTCGRC